MSRKPEFFTLLIDVGQSMHANLPQAIQGLSDFVLNKILNKSNHQAGIIFYGTDVTNNELALTQPALGQHIQIARDMDIPTLDHLRILRQAVKGQGNQNLIDALLVAADYYVRFKENSQIKDILTLKKHIILVSNFIGLPKIPGPGENQLDIIAKTFIELNIHLEIISIDIPLDDDIFSSNKQQIAGVLANLCSKIPYTHTVRHLRNKADLAGLYKAVEVGVVPQLYDFKLGGGGKPIPVKMTAKTKPQKKVGEVGKMDPTAAPGVGSEWSRSVDFTRQGEGAEEEDVPVPEELRMFSYRYGKQIIPIEEYNEDKLEYRDGLSKGIELIGFTQADNIPLHSRLGDAYVLVGDKAVDPAVTAIEALVVALKQRNCVAILRHISSNTRGGVVHYKVQVMVGTPVKGSSNEYPAHLICQAVPYLEDYREFYFGSLDKPDKQPNNSQLDALRNFMSKMSLVKQQPAPAAAAAPYNKNNGLAPQQQQQQQQQVVVVEEFQAGEVPNPTLHRFMSYVTEKEFNPAHQVPAEDPLLERVTQANFASMPGSLTASLALPTVLPVTAPSTQVKKRAVYKLRPGNEKEDLQAMFGQSNYADAASQMRKCIEGLVEVGKYSEGLEMVRFFREECVKHHQPTTYNSQYRALLTRYGAATSPHPQFGTGLQQEDLAVIVDGEEGVKAEEGVQQQQQQPVQGGGGI